MCRKPRLIELSHILPKFLWKNSGVIGGRNKYDIISTDPTESRFHQQDGQKEHLCCRECEARMNRWETVAKNIWFAKESPLRKTELFQSGAILRDVPYREFKLFLMSLLWKMGVSKAAYNEPVKLRGHEQKLRRLLTANDPAEPWRYGCQVGSLTHRGMFLHDYFAQPVELWSPHEPDRCIFCIVAAGVLLAFETTGRKPSESVIERFLAPGRPWIIPTREITSFPALRKDFEGWAKLNGFGI